MAVKTAYKTETGELLYKVEGEASAGAFPDIDGQGWVDGAPDPNLYHVVSGAVAQKPQSIVDAFNLAQAWAALREQRNSLLKASDRNMTADQPLLPSVAAYRAALRDLPQNTSDPQNPVWPSPPATLPAIKADAVARVNDSAGKLRARYITTTPGQELIYLSKEAEAKRWLAATAPNISDYPFIQQEVGITANTPQELAQLWLNLSAAWRGIAALIEKTRLNAIKSIEAAPSAAAVAAVLLAFNAQLAQIGQ